MPKAVGVLNIISGVTHLCGAILILIFGWLGDGILNILWYGLVGTLFWQGIWALDPLVYPLPPELQGTAAIPVMILSILAIVGGICALKRSGCFRNHAFTISPTSFISQLASPEVKYSMPILFA